MSVRSVVVLSLIAIVCLAVVVASALVREQLTAVFGPFQIRDLIRPFNAPVPGPFGFGEVVRGPAPMMAGWRRIASAIASYVFLFLFGLLAMFAFPRRLRVVRDAFGHGVDGLLQNLGIGVFGLFVLVLLTVLGLFTLSAALPLTLVLPMALLLIIWGGLVGLALALGGALSRWAGVKRPAPVLDLAVGALVLFALTRIPLAGVVILALQGMLALGAVIATRFGGGGDWSLAELNPAEAPQP